MLLVWRIMKAIRLGRSFRILIHCEHFILSITPVALFLVKLKVAPSISIYATRSTREPTSRMPPPSNRCCGGGMEFVLGEMVGCFRKALMLVCRRVFVAVGFGSEDLFARRLFDMRHMQISDIGTVPSEGRRGGRNIV